MIRPEGEVHVGCGFFGRERTFLTRKSRPDPGKNKVNYLDRDEEETDICSTSSILLGRSLGVGSA
jgi:hypothetical protein